MNGKREIITKFTYIVIVLAAVCIQTECATVGRQPVTASKQPSSQLTNKGRRMEPAFINAGQQAGVEIWRIEVSINPLKKKKLYYFLILTII